MSIDAIASHFILCAKDQSTTRETSRDNICHTVVDSCQLMDRKGANFLWYEYGLQPEHHSYLKTLKETDTRHT